MKTLPEKFLKAYEPKSVEMNIYNVWEKSGYFNPDNLKVDNIEKDENGKEKVFSMILPPDRKSVV